MSLTGQLALVTGGAAGIGAAIVRRLAERRRHVAIIDIAEVSADAVTASSRFGRPAHQVMAV